MSASVVVVQTTAGGAGAPVAVDVVGTSAFQQVKLVGGAIGVTSPIDVTSGVPAAASQGLVVAVIPGVSVSAQVSGTVSVSGQVQVTVASTIGISGSVDVKQLAFTTGQPASGESGVMVYVAGAVSISGAQVTTGVLPAGGSTGLIVALKPGGQVSATVTGTISIATVAFIQDVSRIFDVTHVSAIDIMSTVNTVRTVLAVSGVTAVSVVSTIGTLLGTVAVNVVAGGAAPGSTAATQTAISGQVVWLAPTQTINVTIAAGAGGGGSVTTAGPSISATGQVVWIAGGQGTTVNPVVVTGNISVSVSAAFSTTALATTTQAAVTGAVVWLAPTQTIIVSGLAGQSVSAVVSGTVSVLNVVPVTTAASVSVTALPVWLNPTQQIVVSGLAGQSVSAVVSGTISVLNVVPVTTAASVSVTGIPVWLNPTQSVVIGGTAVVTLATGGTLATLLGTVAVNVVAGGAGGGSVTTGQPASNATGQKVWLVGGQDPTGTPVLVSGTVTIAGGTTVISGTVAISIPVSQALGTVITILGTQIVTLATGGTLATLLGTVAVNVVAGGAAPGTTATTQTNVTAQVVWLAPTQTIIVSGFAGQSVSAVVSGTVSVLNIAPVTTAASVSVTGWPVWLNPTQQIVVSGFAGQSVSAVVSGTVAISIPVSQALGTVITILGTQIVSVVPMPSISTVNTIIAVSGVTSISNLSTVVTILGTQIVTLATGGTVAALDVGRTQVIIVVTSTSVGISGTMMLMTVYQGITQNTAGASFWVVPAGKTFRVLKEAIVVGNSVTTSPVVHRLFVCVSTAAPTWSSTVPIVAAVGVQSDNATTHPSVCDVGVADVAAAVTVGIGYTIGTSGGTLIQAVISGYLFP